MDTGLVGDSEMVPERARARRAILKWFPDRRGSGGRFCSYSSVWGGNEFKLVELSAPYQGQQPPPTLQNVYQQLKENDPTRQRGNSVSQRSVLGEDDDWRRWIQTHLQIVSLDLSCHPIVAQVECYVCSLCYPTS